jgi:hypothetical protein
MQQRRSLPPHEDDFTRALLRSAEVDEPSSAAYAKVAAALGVGTALGVGASVPAPAVVAAGASGVSGVARWASSLGAKLVLLGVSGALLVGAGGAFLRQRSGAKPVARSVIVKPALVPVSAPAPVSASAPVSALGAPQAKVQPASDAPAALAAASPVEPARAVSSAAPLHGSPHAGLHSAARAAESAASVSSLPEQVQSLDRARVALNSGDASAALREIAHYRDAWPQGVFLTEASVLEIEALAKRGERSLAATRAQAFVNAHPDSPQAERLRALIPADQP